MDIPDLFLGEGNVVRSGRKFAPNVHNGIHLSNDAGAIFRRTVVSSPPFPAEQQPTPADHPFTNEVWIRIMGVSIGAIAYFYIVSARNELMPMLRASVYMRTVAGTAFAIMALIGLAGPALWGFVALEWGGAIWTGVALRGG